MNRNFPISQAFSSVRKLSATDFAVTIATSGRSELLRRTLDSLARCERPAGYRQTVVVENGPRCGAEAVVRSSQSWLNAGYIHFPWGNKSAALNAALQRLDNCLVFFTDDDVRLAPGTLCAIADEARGKSSQRFYGGAMSVDYQAAPPPWLLQYLPCSAKGWELDANDRVGVNAAFFGCNWAAFTHDLRNAGGFNPNLGPGSPSGSTGQETEMQSRLVKNGVMPVYVPEARVWHYVPEDRCSPQWTIDRNFKHGLEDGARAAEENPGPFGLPPAWISRRYLKGILRSFIWSLSPKPEHQFKAKNRRSYDRGLLRGCRSHKQLVEIPNPELPRQKRAA